MTVAPRVELEPLSEQGSADWLRTFDLWATEPFFAAQPWLARRGRARLGQLGRDHVDDRDATLSRRRRARGGRDGAPDARPRGRTRGRAARRARERRGTGLERRHDPHGLDTELAVADTPLRRLATAGDIAQAVAWLLSERASHVTGEVIRVDGGYTITRGSRPDPRNE